MTWIYWRIQSVEVFQYKLLLLIETIEMNSILSVQNYDTSFLDIMLKLLNLSCTFFTNVLLGSFYISKLALL